MIRFLDLFFALSGLIIAFPILVILFVIVFIETGSPLFRQERVGRNGKPFILVKFRSMRVDTEQVASHLASGVSITRVGHFLRRTKLDELPQLWNIVKGEMSAVGPRPCLFNQNELVEARRLLGVLEARPGLTGLAQVNDIDMSTPWLLAETDARMLQSFNITHYFKYIFMTLAGNGSGDRAR